MLQFMSESEREGNSWRGNSIGPDDYSDQTQNQTKHVLFLFNKQRNKHGEKATVQRPKTDYYTLIIINPGVSFTISRTEFSKRSMFDLHSPSLPRVFPTSGWEVIDPSLPIEEETIPTYRVEKFYPVYIGEVFKPSISSSGQIGLWI